MKITLIQHRSAGNDSVGLMWYETRTFDDTATLREVIDSFENYKEDIIIPWSVPIKQQS